MQRYWWPGYELKLLEKLQKQQNNSQFCDTLLQSDGISIPTHSCILAALSPYLSERLLASPSPPFGQKHHLKVHTVKAQTLLKLVALIYSGEVEVNVGVEQNDLLAAAIEFGITDLVEGQKQAGEEEGCNQRVNCQSFWESCKGREGVQGAQVQAEMVGRRQFESPVRANSCAASVVGQEESPSEYMQAQNADFCVTSTPQNLNIEDSSSNLRLEQIPSSVSASDGDSELNCSLSSITDCTAPWSVNVATTSFDSDSNRRLRQGGSDRPQSPAITDLMESESEDQDAVPDAAEESRTSAEQPKRSEVPEVERVKSTEERSPIAGRKNLDLIKQMAQMVERTQISIKVKLVRTQGKVWEVADTQNTDKLSVLSSFKQTTLHSDSDSSSLQSSPASKPATPTVQPAAADASKPPPPPPAPPPSTATALQRGRDCALVQSNRLCSEESDEQIEVLLEDIMMGLNILPGEGRSCRNPALPQLGQDGAQVVCPARGPEERQSRRDARAAAGDGGRVFHRDDRTQVSLSSTDTDQTQSSSFSPSSLQRDAPQCRPPESLASLRGPASPANTPTTESGSCSFAGSPTPRPVTPAESVCRDLSTQDREDTLELLPPAGGNSERSSPSVSLSAIDDLHLPQFLSPLRPVASAGKPTRLFQGARPGCYRTHSNLCPPGRLPTENAETHPWTLRQMDTNQRLTKTRVGDDHQRTSENKPRSGGDVTAQLACNKRSLRRPKEAYVWQERDGLQTPIHLSACSVSLSSNNVLAKERELAVSSSCKSKGTQSVGTDSSKIQTRGFLKKIQEASCQTKAKDSFVSKAAVCTSDAVNNGEVAPLKRKRGRPFSKRGPPKQIVAGASDPVPRDHQSDHSTTLGDGGGIKTKRKRRRKTREAGGVPHKRTRRAGKAEAGDNHDVALATKRCSPKRTRKMKRKFAQRPKSAVTRVNGNKDEGTNEPERHEESSDYKLMEEKDAAENQDVLTPTLDENSNPLENTEGHEGNSCSFTGDEVNLHGDESHGEKLHGEELHGKKLQGEELHGEELHGDILGEEVGQFPAETTELLQNPREATQNDTLPQGDKSLSDCNSNPERHNAVQISPQPHQVPFNGPCQHEQVDVEGEEVEEEKEEEEIEVVLYSPVPYLRVYENILDSMDMLEVEEEEKGDDDDDLSEIDVTGDEAE